MNSDAVVIVTRFGVIDMIVDDHEMFLMCEKCRIAKERLESLEATLRCVVCCGSNTMR